MRRKISKIDEASITSEAQLDEILTEQKADQVKRNKAEARSKRITSILILIIALAAYLEWHYTKGGSNIIGLPFVQTCVLVVLYFSVRNVVNTKY